jgi:hypothetical protein
MNLFLFDGGLDRLEFRWGRLVGEVSMCVCVCNSVIPEVRSLSVGFAAQ